VKPLPVFGLPALAAALLAGCTTTHTLSVSQANTAAISFAQGKPWLESAKRNTVAVWLLTPTYQTHLSELLPPAFFVVVRNGGDRLISLSSGDITATAAGHPVHLLTYEEYRDEIDRQARQAMVGIWSQAGGLTGRTELPERWGLNSNDQPDHLPPELILSPGVDSALLDRRAQAQGLVLEFRRNALLADARWMLELNQSAIAPGHSAARVLRLRPSDLSSGQRLRILVKTGDETHEFLYEVEH
jgi:hypothetical protein